MTDICFYYIFRTVQPNFIKFSPKILKYISLYESVIISIWQKTKWRPKWRTPKYLCLQYLFNRSTDFHKIFTKNLEIYFQIVGICKISIWQKTKWCPKWRPPRYLCLLYLFNCSTDFSHIFTKNFEIYLQLIGICSNSRMVENKMASTSIFVFTVSLQLFYRFSSNFHQKS